MKTALLFAMTVGVLLSVTPALAAQTGYPLTVNNELVNNDQFNNPGHKQIVVVAWCNATVMSKDIEAHVGMNSPGGLQPTVASESGTGRLSVTFVVPWNWYYKIVVNQLNGTGMPPGGVCPASAWWMQ
ncbi:MAG TPA: hypothetical protein VII56_07765 [Rhizomicrobium sp.]